jgi:hypothetical protein
MVAPEQARCTKVIGVDGSRRWSRWTARAGAARAPAVSERLGRTKQRAATPHA